MERDRETDAERKGNRGMYRVFFEEVGERQRDRDRDREFFKIVKEGDREN